MHALLVSAYVTNDPKSFSTDVTRELVLVLAVHLIDVTCQIGHNCTTNVASVLHTIVLHPLVHLHLGSVAATETAHITLEWSVFVVALFNVYGKVAHLKVKERIR